jgi:transposase
VSRARQIGPHVSQLIDRLLSEKIHPEQGYRPCLGIIRLADRYGEDRLEAACRRALDYSAVSYKSVKSILDKGLDRVTDQKEPQAPIEHANIRGRDAYVGGGRSC